MDQCRQSGRSPRRTVPLLVMLTDSEMLRFKLAAFAMGRKRSSIVRERIIDLITAPRPNSAASVRTALLSKWAPQTPNGTH